MKILLASVLTLSALAYLKYASRPAEILPTVVVAQHRSHAMQPPLAVVPTPMPVAPPTRTVVRPVGTPASAPSLPVPPPILAMAPAPAAPVAPPVVPGLAPLLLALQRASGPNQDEFNGYAEIELAQQAEGMERIQMIRHGITVLANTNLPQALELANSLPEQHDHGVAVGTIIRSVAERSPALAAEIAFTQVPPETTQQLLTYPRTAALMNDLLAQNPGPALQWAATMSASEASAENNASSSLARNVLPGDSNQAALTWASAIADPIARAALENYVQRISKAP